MKKILLFAIVILSLNVQAQNYRYLNRVFTQTQKTANVVYGNAPSISSVYVSEAVTNNIDLKMDIFQPVGDTETKRPVVMLMHAGGFINGTKNHDDMQWICDSFALRGYVTCSIDYRLNFNLLSSNSAERAVYRGVQDASAAIRFLKEKSAIYKIDTTQIFAWGSSAGGFSALNLAFLDDSERPASTFVATLRPDLGCINCSGNTYQHSSKIQAAVNCWGAIGNTTWINTSNNNVPTIMFHGTADNYVPYNTGSPFGLGTLPTTYGSLPIDARLTSQNILHEFYTGQGKGHEYWGATNGSFATAPTADYLDIIKKTALFLYKRLPIPPLTLSITNITIPICNGLNTGSAKVTAAGGANLPTTYQWSNGQTGQTATNLSAGIYTCTATCGTLSTTIQVPVNQPFAINIVGSNLQAVTCISAGSVNLSTTNAVGNVTYAWSNGATGATFTTNNPSTYQVTATDANGCKQSTSITIFDNKIFPTANAGVDKKLTCVTQSVNIGSGLIAGNSYLWSNGITSASQTISAANTYKLTVTDLQNGCKNTDEVVVSLDNIPPTINPISPPTLTCSNPSATLVAVVSGQNMTYNWTSNSASNPNLVVNAIGNYIVTVTNNDNGCKSQLAVSVLENKILPTVSILGANAFCIGQSTTLTAQSSDSSFVWNNGLKSKIITVQNAGVYKVTVTASNGCTSLSSKNVLTNALPQVVILGKTLFCEGSKTILFATNSNFKNYNWSNGVTKDSATISQQGIYKLTITDNNGCSNQDSITVKVAPNPKVATSNIKACEGQSASLSASVSASNTVTYVWKHKNSFQATTPNIGFNNLKLSDAGYYYIKVVDTIGCIGQDSALLSISPKMNLTLAHNLNCSNLATITSTVSGGISPYNYVWNVSNLNQSSVQTSAPTQVNVEVRDAYACKITNPTIYNIASNPSIDVKEKITNSNGNDGSIVLTPSNPNVNYTYIWSNGSTTKDIQNLKIGQYCVTITDQNTCTKTACFEVKQAIVATNDINVNSKISIFPNPSHDYLNLAYDDNLEIKDIKAYNINGVEINILKMDRYLLDISNWKSGVYLLRIKTNVGLELKKVVKID